MNKTDKSNSKCLNDENNPIVVSGMSGRFPSCCDIDEYESKLYNGIYMCDDSEIRYKHTNPIIPRFTGKIPNASKFDSTFFGINPENAGNIDPQFRILVEETYKAIMDAGVNPGSLRGSNTGVYVGMSTFETQNRLFNPKHNGIDLISGCHPAMVANYVSYHLGLHGPSMMCDSACSSSITAFHMAVRALQSGQIDAAIVGGVNLCLHPNLSLQFVSLGVLSADGLPRTMDADANGYVRSEGIVSIYLKRKFVAKRVYAEVIDSAVNCDGFKAEGISYPSAAMQTDLLRKIYTKNNIDVNNLGFFEAHCTSTNVGDPEECKAIDRAICSQRSETMLVGSVKSNCGHSESAAGLFSIIKLMLTLNNGVIPPNINFNKPKESITALIQNRMKVVTTPTKLPKPYVAANSFGFGGANAHAIFKQFEKQKYQEESVSPRLVVWSARSLDSVQRFLADLEKRPLDLELIALAHGSQSGGIKLMTFRGFSVLHSENNRGKPIVHNKVIQHWNGAKRPVVYVFSGIGTDLIGRVKRLMEMLPFKQSIERSSNTLKPTGINLVKILTTEDQSQLKNILHSFVINTALQIALVDLLRELNITPDLLVGHSFGEIGCAYADECLTAEQVMLTAYYYGKVIFVMNKAKGAMATIGIGAKEISSMLPTTIDIACRNSPRECIISGPSQDVTRFIKILKSKGVPVIEYSSDIAYHSRAMNEFGSQILKYLKHIIPTPKCRSHKWLTASEMYTDNQLCSAEFLTKSFLDSVRFDQCTKIIPRNAISIEISQNATLQNIIENTVANSTHIGLMQHNCEDPLTFLLSALGHLYINGLEVTPDKLYANIAHPVSRGTRTLSPLIRFYHEYDNYIYKLEDRSSGKGAMTFSVKLAGRYQYLKGHEIDGRVLIPATFYLECVWQTFSDMCGVPQFENMSVELSNIKFERATTLTGNNTCDLKVLIHRFSGRFEVTESDSLVATGEIREIKAPTKPKPIILPKGVERGSIKKKDFYKELKLRGYHYNGEFQGVEMSTNDGAYGKVRWTQNWVTFMDCILQMSIIGQDSRTLMLPTSLRTLRICPQLHKSLMENESIAEFYADKLLKRIVCGGIEFMGLDASAVQRRRIAAEPVLEKYIFLPHFPAPMLHLNDIAKCCIQLVLENQPKSKLEITELALQEEDSYLIQKLMQAVGDLPLVTGNYKLIHKRAKGFAKEQDLPNITQLYSEDEIDGDISDIVVLDARASDDINSKIVENMDPNGFLIIRESSSLQIETFEPKNGFLVWAFYPSDKHTFVMIKRQRKVPLSGTTATLEIASSDIEFGWIEKLQNLDTSKKDVLLVSQGEKHSGILGLTNCLRKEPETKNIRCVFIASDNAANFDVTAPLFRNHLELGMGVNVYKNGMWGTYRHLTISEEYPTTSHTDHVYGNIVQIGDLSSLRWFQGPLTVDKEISIMYSSLNFKDVMQASGRLPIAVFGKSRLGQTCIFGFEYSGTDTRTGKHIMGMTFQGAVSSHLHNPPPLVWGVPKTWSLRDAATVPVVYLTVYYAFFYTADIRKGKSILIHAGSGGIGIAAIRVAQAYGLEVFTTVSTAEKKAFLLRTFPTLNENYIGNSRDTSFEAMIAEKTQGRGVDFVLNSLSEDKLKASIRCLGKGGHFLEIGKFDMAKDNSLGLGVFQNELTFHAILADNLLRENEKFIETLKNHMSKDIEKGIILPLPSTVFLAQEMTQAFRFLMSGQHIGKVLIQIRDNPESVNTLPISVMPQVYFSPNLSYIIPGGLGGFGLELIDWMILRGARKIILSSTRGISNDYQKLRIALWKSYGSEMHINTSDIGTASGCSELLTAAMKLAPVGGIFNLAVLLRDATFTNQTLDLFLQSFKPKALATKYLDELSRKLCPNLQHFVIFSSVSCGRGNAGQTNYGMANSIMERIIEDRVANGFPGKAVQWGAVGEVGLVADMAAGKIDLEIGGTLQQRISSCIQVLDVLLTSADPVVSSMVVAEKKANSAGQSLIDFVLTTLSIRDIKSISVNTTLAELGMDSLMSVEIKQALERDYDIVLNTSDVRTLTILKLIDMSEKVGSGHITEMEDERNTFEQLRLFYGQISHLGDSSTIFDSINDVTEGNPIIIIPGIEGCNSDMWRKLGPQLKSPTKVLQFHNTVSATSVTEIVDFATKNICGYLKKHNTKQFQIVGYSLGAMLGHFVMCSLESKGYHGRAILIDGSPEWIQTMMTSYATAYEELEFEIMGMATMLALMLPRANFQTISHEMHSLYTEGELILYMRDKLREANTEKLDDIMLNIKVALGRLKILMKPETYEAVGVVKAELLLLKPTIETISKIDEFYGLQPFTQGSINLEILEGDHQTILSNEKLPEIINTYFSTNN